jgi:glycine cleavage system regulatory protein
VNVRVILSVVGSDRPGLTQALADAVFHAGGNWLESHLSRLGGKYVGSVLVELAPAGLPELEQRIRQVDTVGLHVSLVAADDKPPASGDTLWIELVGSDRPGIVLELTAALAAVNVNIEEFVTAEESGAWSGERLFRASARLLVPDGTSSAEVQAALEAVSGDIMVDFTSGQGGQAEEPA